MIDFIMCVVQYILIAIVLVAIGGLGVFIGIKMRKSSDAKAAMEEMSEEK